MKINASETTNIRLSELDQLDPISVIVDDAEPGKGRITITCFDKVWTAYWGAMGERSVSEFFRSCDEHYLAGSLAPMLQSTIMDEDKISEEIDEAFDLVSMADYHNQLVDLYGDDYLHDAPTTDNPQYLYLCRIIKTVQDGLKQHEAPLSGKLKFSMDGFRKNLSAHVVNLRDAVSRVVEGKFIDHEELIDATNEVIQASNIINCTFDPKNPDFSDLSELEVPHLETSDSEQID